MGNSRRCLLTIGLSILTPILMSGCIGATRLPVRAKTASGHISDPDLKFLQVGATTRDELKKNLAPIDTGAAEPDLFWGRWERSSWGYFFFLGGPQYVGAAGGRVWGEHNVLVALDDKGVVKSWVIVSDKKLSSRLDHLDAKYNKPINLPAQAIGHMGTYQVDLILSADKLEYKNVRASDSRVWSAPQLVSSAFGQSGQILRRNIRSITAERSSSENPACIQIRINLRERAILTNGSKYRGKNLWLAVDPRTFLLLRRYLSQTSVKN